MRVSRCVTFCVSSWLRNIQFAARLDQLRRLLQVAFVHDVVSLENANGLVSADLHGHRFTNASPGHVPDGTAPEIVKVQPLVAVELLPILALCGNPMTQTRPDTHIV